MISHPCNILLSIFWTSCWKWCFGATRKGVFHNMGPLNTLTRNQTNNETIWKTHLVEKLMLLHKRTLQFSCLFYINGPYWLQMGHFWGDCASWRFSCFLKRYIYIYACLCFYVYSKLRKLQQLPHGQCTELCSKRTVKNTDNFWKKTNPISQAEFWYWSENYQSKHTLKERQAFAWLFCKCMCSNSATCGSSEEHAEFRVSGVFIKWSKVSRLK